MVEVGAGVEHELVGDDRRAALAGRRGRARQRERSAVVGVGVVGQHVDRQRQVLGGRAGVGDRHRGVVGAGDRDGQGRARARAMLVGHGVAHHHRLGDARRRDGRSRCRGRTRAGWRRRRAALAGRRGALASVNTCAVVGVGVVGQHVDRQRQVLGGRAACRRPPPGVSLVPVTVMVRVELELAPWSSVMV